MGIEVATYISQLSSTNPLGTDPVSEGDQHLRLIKSVLQSQFTNLGTTAVTADAATLNTDPNAAAVAMAIALGG
jgi:hypothetical protein